MADDCHTTFIAATVQLAYFAMTDPFVDYMSITVMAHLTLTDVLHFCSSARNVFNITVFVTQSSGMNLIIAFLRAKCDVCHISFTCQLCSVSHFVMPVVSI